MKNRTLSVLSLMAVLLGIAVSCPVTSGAVTWGYPSDSTLGQCLASRYYKYELYPDRDTALAAAKADYDAAKAVCDGLSPQPSWCWGINLRYWEWNCAYTPLPQCLTSCTCGVVGCPGVTDCGFTCQNCREHVRLPGGYWPQVNYWYPVCTPGGDPPPAQIQDAPVATEVTDINAGGGCNGKCDILVGDGGGVGG
jgi:hypothetical protein